MLLCWLSKHLLPAHQIRVQRHFRCLHRIDPALTLRHRSLSLRACRFRNLAPTSEMWEVPLNEKEAFLATINARTISQITKAETAEEIDRIFQDIKYASEETQRMVNFVRAYEEAIRRLLELKQSSKALEYFDEMRQRNLNPTIKCWTMIIHALTRSFATFKLGLRLFDDMKRSTIPDAICYHVVIYNCHIFREYKSAVRYYEEMLRCGITPKFCTQRTLIEMLVKVNKLDEAKKIAKILESQFEGQPKLPSAVWNTILRMHCLGRDIKAAEETLSKMSNNGISLDCESYHALLDMYVETKCPEKAIEMFAQTNEKFKNVTHTKTSGILLKAYISANRLADAWKLFEDLKTSGSLTVNHCNVMLSILANRGDIDECITVIRQMQSLSIPFSSFTYGPLITLFDNANQPEKGLEYYNQARKSNMLNESSIYRALQLCVNHKLATVATNIISDAVKKSHRVNLTHFMRAIEANVAVGHFHDALEIVFLFANTNLYLSEEFVYKLCSFLDAVTLPSELTNEKEKWKNWKRRKKHFVDHKEERNRFITFLTRCFQSLYTDDHTLNTTTTTINNTNINTTTTTTNNNNNNNNNATNKNKNDVYSNLVTLDCT